MPRNWPDVLGDIAAHFHFPPAALWEMDADEISFWHHQVLRISAMASPPTR
ncbi:GpE family phage tail protein [Nevskia sp.]|uniref:GpE family phage tail protein n=1 Tax=Nevskia sp. TaxID=1929292 RepID=UPI003F70F9F7